MKTDKHKEGFYKAWWYLKEHSMFKQPPINEPYFLGSLDIDVAKVNPKTKKIDDNESKNTEVNIWLECGPHEEWEEGEFGKMKGFTHDIRLDCGGKTFEEAIIVLAKLVKKFYD